MILICALLLAAAEREANHLDAASDLYRTGSIAYDRDRFKEAAEAFRRFVQLKPATPSAWAFLGLCEFELGSYDAGLKHLAKARALGLPEDDDLGQVSQYHYVLLLTRTRSFDQAIAQITAAAQRVPATEQWFMAAGLAGLRRPLLPRKLAAPDRPLVQGTGEAIWLQATRQTAPALHLYETLVAKYPGAPGLHFLYGSYLIGSDPVRAAAELQRELEITPAHIPALVVLVLEYLRKGDPAQAEPLARRAAEAAPDDFAAHTVYGRVLAAEERYPESVRELEHARDLAPGSPEARFSLASAYAQAGRQEGAAAERAEFLRLRKLRSEQQPARP